MPFSASGLVCTLARSWLRAMPVGDDLAGGQRVVVALARGDGLAGGEDLDGVHAVLRASVGAADVEEDEESADGGDDGGDDEEDPAAIHRR